MQKLLAVVARLLARHVLDHELDAREAESDCGLAGLGLVVEGPVGGVVGLLEVLGGLQTGVSFHEPAPGNSGRLGCLVSNKFNCMIPNEEMLSGA